jgi:hypothetical protein
MPLGAKHRQAVEDLMMTEKNAGSTQFLLCRRGLYALAKYRWPIPGNLRILRLGKREISSFFSFNIDRLRNLVYTEQPNDLVP